MGPAAAVFLATFLIYTGVKGTEARVWKGCVLGLALAMLYQVGLYVVHDTALQLWGSR
jgi:hypothetical protein